MAELSESPTGPGGELDLYEAIRDGIYMLDADGRITWVNEVALEEFDLGYSRDDLLGSHVSTIMPSEDVETCDALIQELLKRDSKDSERCEIHLESVHGSTIPVELHLSVRTGEDGEFQGTVGVIRDITKRRQRQERLMVLTRLLRHNLRQKINVIGGRLELVEEKHGLEPQEHFVAIEEALRELSELSEKTLEVHWAMADTGRLQDQTDAVETVHRVTERVADQYPTAQISVSAPERAPVEADRTLDIVIENLVENAVEHSDHDSPTVDIIVSQRSESEGEWTTVSIADDGPGIPEDELQPLATGQETPLRHGSGLGLWLVKWVIERFGGEVTFEDREPRGTVVGIRLKRAASVENSQP